MRQCDVLILTPHLLYLNSNTSKLDFSFFFLRYSWPYLQPRWNLPYHSSSLLATALDALTLPVRCATVHCGLPQLQSFMTHGSSRHLVNCGVALPLAKSADGFLVDLIDGQPLYKLFSSVSPFASQLCTSSRRLSLSVRGLPDISLVDASHKVQDNQQLQECRSALNFLHWYVREKMARSSTLTFVSPSALRLRQPFPAFFKACLMSDVQLAQLDSCTAQQNSGSLVLPSSATTAAYMQSGDKETAAALLSFRASLTLPQLSRFCAASQDGLEVDELVEALEELQKLADLFQPNESAI